MNDRIRTLEGLLVLAEARQKILEKYNLVSTGEQALIEGIRKMVEDEKKIAMTEASRPVVVQPAKRSWQDNPWLYIAVGIVIGVISTLIGQMIISGISQ